MNEIQNEKTDIDDMNNETTTCCVCIPIDAAYSSFFLISILSVE